MGLLHSASQTNMVMEGSGTGHCEGMIYEMTWYQQGRRNGVRAPVKISPPPATADRLKIFTLYPKD